MATHINTERNKNAKEDAQESQKETHKKRKEKRKNNKIETYWFSNENFGFKLNTEIILNFIATGVALYVLVGIFGLLYGGNFLDYSYLSLSNDTSSGQKIGIFLVEIGVGLTVSGVMVLIYKMFNNSKA